MNFYKEYPKSAFPKLPVIVDIDNNNHYYDSPVSSYESIFNTSIFQRVLVSRVNHRRHIQTIYESLTNEHSNEYAVDEESDEEEEENDGEEDIVEEDTTDDSDSVS